MQLVAWLGTATKDSRHQYRTTVSSSKALALLVRLTQSVVWPTSKSSCLGICQSHVAFLTSYSLNSRCQGSSILSTGEFILFNAVTHADSRSAGVFTNYEISDGIQSDPVDMVASTLLTSCFIHFWWRYHYENTLNIIRWWELCLSTWTLSPSTWQRHLQTVYVRLYQV